MTSVDQFAANSESYDNLRDEEVGTFTLRVNGETVWETKRHVTKISLQTARGEVGSAGIAPGQLHDTYVDVIVEETDLYGPVRLDELNLVNQRVERDRLTRVQENVGDDYVRPNSPQFLAEVSALPGDRPSDGADPLKGRLGYGTEEVKEETERLDADQEPSKDEEHEPRRTAQKDPAKASENKDASAAKEVTKGK